MAGRPNGLFHPTVCPQEGKCGVNLEHDTKETRVIPAEAGIQRGGVGRGHGR